MIEKIKKVLEELETQRKQRIAELVNLEINNRHPSIFAIDVIKKQEEIRILNNLHVLLEDILLNNY